MYGAPSYLLYSRDLEEQRSGEGGLKSLYGRLGGKPEREDFYGVKLAPPDAMMN